MNYDIVHVQPRRGYRLFLRFADGLSGEVDVSKLAGKGVFKVWKKPGFFAKAFIDSDSRTVCWPGEIDLAPDALYENVLEKYPLNYKKEKESKLTHNLHELRDKSVKRWRKAQSSQLLAKIRSHKLRKYK